MYVEARQSAKCSVFPNAVPVPGGSKGRVKGQGMDWGCPQSQQTGTVPRLYLRLKPPSQALKKPYIMKLTLQSTFLSWAGFAFLATQRRPSGYSIT